MESAISTNLSFGSIVADERPRSSKRPYFCLWQVTAVGPRPLKHARGSSSSRARLHLGLARRAPSSPARIVLVLHSCTAAASSGCTLIHSRTAFGDTESASAISEIVAMSRIILTTCRITLEVFADLVRQTLRRCGPPRLSGAVPARPACSPG